MVDKSNLWSSIDSALFVVDYSSLDELKKYREVIRDSGLNVNNCELLAVVESKKERLLMSQQSVATFISDKDLNVFGQLKNPEAQKILKRKFKLMLTIADKPKRLTKLLNKIDVSVKVGVNCTNIEQDVNLKTEGKSPSQLINFARQTLEKIV